MKYILTRLFIIMTLAAYSIQAVDSAMRYFNDPGLNYCEEAGTKSKGGVEETEKKEEKLYRIAIFTHNFAALKQTSNLNAYSTHSLPSDGYCQRVFSPPDLA